MAEINSLATIDKARQMLAEAKSLDDILRVNDLAEAAIAYAKAAKLGTDAQNIAAETAVRAKRKAGEALAKLERNQGHRSDLTSSNDGQSSSPYREALEESQVSPQDAARWQQIAQVPEEVIEDYFEETKQDGKEITTAGALRVARESQSEQSVNATPPVPDGKYRVIYADPPWKYGNTMPDYMGVQDDHYPLMTIEEICALPIRDLAEDNAVLFLWVTSPILEDAFRVARAWGFEYKASFIWDKVKHVMGHYNSVRHEFLFVCTRGSCPPDVKRLFDSVVSIERTEHSVKPEFFREVIDTIYPFGKRIELFARKTVDGWDAFGNQTEVSRQYQPELC